MLNLGAAAVARPPAAFEVNQINFLKVALASVSIVGFHLLATHDFAKECSNQVAVGKATVSTMCSYQ